MVRQQQISRSFPVLTLLLAIPLVAILAYVSYDRYIKDNGDGWQTYRNERFGYEIRIPPTWEVELDNDDGEIAPGVPAKYTSFIDRSVPTPDITKLRPGDPPPIFLPKAVALINVQGSWCLHRVEKTAISVNGFSGSEYVCYQDGGYADGCAPQPACRDQPLGIARDFERNGARFRVYAHVSPGGGERHAAEFDIARRVVQSFRFTD